MTTLKLLDTKGAEKGSITFPIHENLREDLIRRAVIALQSRARQPYGADPRAGLKHSTRISRRRRDYRGSYGQGIARSPRKILSRNGRRIFWVGAEAPNTVGGRRAHPPKAQKVWERKINRKENRKAINSAMTATLNPAIVAARGHKIPKNYPFALSADFESLNKTKDVVSALTTLGFAEDLIRGVNGGKSLLIVTESEEFAAAASNIIGIDVASAAQLNAHMLAPGAHPGRATLFTEASIKALTEKPAQLEAPQKAKTVPKKEPAKKTVPAAKSTPKKTPAKKAASAKPKAAKAEATA